MTKRRRTRRRVLPAPVHRLLRRRRRRTAKRARRYLRRLARVLRPMLAEGGSFEWAAGAAAGHHYPPDVAPGPPPPPARFAAFGQRSFIISPALIRNPHRIHIGKGVFISERALFSVVEHWLDQHFEPRLTIGDNTYIAHNLFISCVSEVAIGKQVMLGGNSWIGDTYHDYRDPDLPAIQKPMAEPRAVRIEDGAHVGMNVIILPGVTIGRNAYVGAGSVVTSDVPPKSVVAGNPAQVIKQWDDAAREWRSCV